MSEMLVQACLYAQGMCQIAGNCGRDGQFELNVTIPLIAHSLHEAISVLTEGSRVFAERCVQGLTPNAEQLSQNLKRSLMLVTALNPHIGYDQASKVAKRAFAEDKTLKQVVLEEGLMTEDAIDEALDPSKMLQPGE